jgi:hypothetical protein
MSERILSQSINTNTLNTSNTQPIPINECICHDKPFQRRMSCDESLGGRYQYDLKPDIFDPFSSSPPGTFMLKLKERIHSYSSQSGFPLHTKDLIRKSE